MADGLTESILILVAYGRLAVSTVHHTVQVLYKREEPSAISHRQQPAPFSTKFSSHILNQHEQKGQGKKRQEEIEKERKKR